MAGGENNRENDRRMERQLAGLIARMPDEDPPGGLAAAVMGRVKPKRPGWFQRMRLLVHGSLVTTGGLVPAGVVAILVAAALFLYRGKATLPGATPGNNKAAAATVHLALEWPAAGTVAVIGSFNNWNPEGFRMHRQSPEGPWVLDLALPQGRHAYAFLIDGNRVVADPGAIWQEEDGFGGRNATLFVPNGKSDENKL